MFEIKIKKLNRNIKHLTTQDEIYGIQSKENRNVFVITTNNL